MDRYFIYNYSISSTILIDTIDKTITIYQTNLYGQFYNLKTAEPKVINNAKISGLIKRLMCVSIYDKENRTKTEEFDGKTRAEMLNYCKELIV